MFFNPDTQDAYNWNFYLKDMVSPEVKQLNVNSSNVLDYFEVLDWLRWETSAWTALLNIASYLCHLASTEYTIK